MVGNFDRWGFYKLDPKFILQNLYIYIFIYLYIYIFVFLYIYIFM